jgi:Fe-S cluster assembly protein SufD
MMTQLSSEIDLFQQLLEGFYRDLPKDPLEKIRKKAWERFLEVGLPTRRSEVFRYLKMRSLYDKTLHLAEKQPLSGSFEHAILPECADGLIVFVNGAFQPHLSRLNGFPKKAVLLPMEEALKTYGSFIQNQWTREIKEESDPFALLNAALHPAAAFLYLPPKTIVETPVQVLHLIDTHGDPLLLLPRLHLFAGAQAHVQLYSTQTILSGEGYFSNGVADFSIEESAHVHYVQTALLQPPMAWTFDALRCQLKRHSTLQTVAATTGGATVRYDYRIALTGENGEAQLNGIGMLAEKNEAHTHVLIDHQAPHCRSMQLFKGALADFSHSSFEGKILVRQEAQKTDAFQLNNNLLLSDRAAADSKPNLEIFADDVKASHGATVGQLDKEHLFYMKTRGFAESQAKSLLVRGFCEEVIAKVDLPSLRSQIKRCSENFIP